MFGAYESAQSEESAPWALLDLPRYAVIRAQVATALPLLACNLLLMAALLWW